MRSLRPHSYTVVATDKNPNLGLPKMANENDRRRLATGDVSPMMGVYRCREKVNGRNAWYGILQSGEQTEIMVAERGEKDSRVVARIARLVYGPTGPGPLLTVIPSNPSARGRLSVGLTARICAAANQRHPRALPFRPPAPRVGDPF